jgi:hypothetical protein
MELRNRPERLGSVRSFLRGRFEMKIRVLSLAGMLALLLAMMLSSCAGLPSPSPSYPSEVDWETAIEILNSGDVEMVAQLHSLDVYLTLKDGSEIHTIEPVIDAIFEAVDQCGRPCNQIILATE